MKIAVIGTGYVGLVSGTCFAETGITVTCVDIDKDKISKLENGIIPIYEPGLKEMVKRNVDNKRLNFSTSIEESLKNIDALFIAVGTPPDEDGSADLSHVLAVAKDIGKYLNKYIVVVDKSTVPVGTAQLVKETIQKELDSRNNNIEFDVVSNPEFLKEGNAIEDFLKPDRIVVGAESDRAKKVMERLYNPFIINNHPVIFMDILSAELTKYAANSMLATKISFMNDIANLCEFVGADIDSVRVGIGSDSRIGNKFIHAGCGYGGSCFPKDVKALIKTADENNHSLELLKSVERVNENQKEVLFNKILSHFKWNLRGKKIAIWGVSFKPKTDDMREAPSLVIIDKLLNKGAEITVFDPVAMEECKRILGNKVQYATDQYTALDNADALAIITEWSEFKVPKFTFIEKRLKEKVIFDGRNIYDLDQMKEFGFTYYSIGRKNIN